MKVLHKLLPLLLLALVAGCAAPVAAPSAPAGGEAAAPAGDMPYAGTTLRLVGANHPWQVAITPLLADFEAATGIKVNFEAYGEDQLNQKLTTEFTAGGSDIDVFMQRPLQEARVMQMNGWYEDLANCVSDPDYDFADFADGAVGTEMVDGVLTGVPIVTEAEVLYYRKDLLEAAGIAVPTTLDELKAAAEALTDKDNAMYGFVARGQRSPLVTQFSSFLYSSGGDWFDADRQATINTPEALAAIDLYGTLLREYGPPGVLNMSWPQAVAIFAQGNAAMYTDASSIYANVLDPELSAVADKTGVAVFPAGPAGPIMYNVTSWGLAIPSGSQNKEAACEFIKWATSKDIVLKTQGEGAVPGARDSVWADPAGSAAFPADWVTAVAASSNGRGYDRPLVTAVTEARDIIGGAVTVSIEGGDFETAANDANAQFQALLDGEQ
ncbi:MAG: sugar ABC transporter substrate-binding protein [Anaerolineales bacterium]|nr:sugar ABC transporter substrate-binding protein [Anaerolineales bacterium]